MPFSESTSIAGAASGSLAAALAYVERSQAKRKQDTRAYVNELYRLCEAAGIDFAVAFAQWCVETGVGISHLWATRLNPAGIGALETLQNPGVIDYVGLTYETGEEAAQAHVVHLYVYAFGKIAPGHVLHPYIGLDPRYDAVIQAGYAGKAKTIKYLETRWAADNEYASKLVFRLNDVFDEPAQAPTPTPAPQNPKYVLGRVPKPNIEVRIIENNTAWDDLGPRTPHLGFVFHTMEGTLLGTDSYFRNEARHRALTDFGVGNGGRIFQWVDINGRRSPHASGPATDPEGDGNAFLDKYGVNALNCRLISIEIEGNMNSPIPNADWVALVELTAWLVDSDLKMTVEEWWYISGLTCVFGHYEFSPKVCPGVRLINRWEEFLLAVAERLRYFQTSEVDDPDTDEPDPKPQYAPVSPIPDFDGSADVTLNGVTFHADRQQVTAIVSGVSVRQYATSSAPETRAPFKADEQFEVIGWVNGQQLEDETRWWITSEHERLWVGGTIEKPGERPDDATPDAPDVVMVNGKAYYEMGSDGNGRSVAIERLANLRAQPSTDAAVVRDALVGELVTAAYWTVGEAIEGESVWYVLNTIDGPYLWSGATDTRPY